VGSVTFARLIERFGTAAAALRALPDLAGAAGRAGSLKIPRPEEIEAELTAGAAIGAELVASCEPDFPSALAMTDPPPPVLWTLGDRSVLARGMVAIVGARTASASGRKIARDLADALGQAGWVVVSGLARGIDSAAHQGALAHGTAAVLAGGVDNIYPPEHAELHAAVRRSGCVVSERPIGAVAKAADFPRRNRIISGLSRGVIVVEAELRSGSLITARFAGEQGREVFAVPGSPLDPRARGTNDLLRQGATLVEEPVDVLRVLDTLPGLAERRFAAALAADLPEQQSPPGDEDEATALRDRIHGLLSPAPTAINDLARESGAPVSAVLAVLTELTLAGRAELAPGNLAIGL
jgi:DNA processing protein